jgi:hypothetical protein
MFLTGSIWRRWDLHVHTPETILNNQFGNWEEYLEAIEAHPDVKVIGVTDYMSITNYSKLKAYKARGRIANIDLLIPNIEFRIAPPTDDGQSNCRQHSSTGLARRSRTRAGDTECTCSIGLGI